MKVTTSKPEPEFKPVSVTFTFDTQAELDAFGSLFNTSVVIRALCGVSGSEEWSEVEIFGVLAKAGASFQLTREFTSYFDRRR